MTEQRGLPVVSPAMRKVLLVSLVLFTLLVLDSVYLSSVTFLTWLRGISLEGVFYQWMFLAHLVLGVLIIVPILVYSVMHIRSRLETSQSTGGSFGNVTVCLCASASCQWNCLDSRSPWVRSQTSNGSRTHLLGPCRHTTDRGMAVCSSSSCRTADSLAGRGSPSRASARCWLCP